MKKETKRYMLVEYAGTKERVYETKEELDKVLDDIRKYNNRKTAKYICGNISVNEIDGKYHVNIHLYNKLSNKNTISDIDNFTQRFNKNELASYFAPQSKMLDGYESDINVAYFETKDANISEEEPLLIGVKYIPVLYKDDLKYMDETYMKKCLSYHANSSDTGFFRELANEFYYHHICSKEVDDLFECCDKVDNQGFNPNSLYYIALDLYNKIKYEREKDGSLSRDNEGKYQISVRRKRDFMFFLKNYHTKKINSPLKYNGSTIRMRKEDLIRQREFLLRREEIKALEHKLK